MYVLRLAAALALPLLAAGLAADEIEPPSLKLPEAGSIRLSVISPQTLEVAVVAGAAAADAPLRPEWNPVDEHGQFVPPPASEFRISVDGKPAAVDGIGFKRRVLYAGPAAYDLRVGDWLYLRLAGSGAAPGSVVTVTDTLGKVWAAAKPLRAAADPLRLSPALHVNQEGYLPDFPKRAMVGYFLGSLGELGLAEFGRFQLVAADTGAVVFEGALLPRPDSGYTDLPTPYQQVREADFSAFRTPGLYRLAVAGLGASLPFRIDGGIAMDAVRTYALGLYHQRCGTDNALPFTRFVHGVCHTAPAEVPVPQTRFPSPGRRSRPRPPISRAIPRAGRPG